MKVDDVFVPNGVSRNFRWGCRCILIAISETEYTFRMAYNKHEFRLRIADFPNTNWVQLTGWEVEKCWACGNYNMDCDCDD